MYRRQFILQNELGYLKALAVQGDKALDIGMYRQYTRSELQQILLDCLYVNIIINATIVTYEVKHQHIGAGVYKVWLAKTGEKNNAPS